MRHRAVVRAERAGPPRNPDERRLEQLQARLTAATNEVNHLTTERDRLALRLWLDDNVPQSEIAERLDRADRRAGGSGISYAATQKRIWRRRDQLLTAS
jgi:hypothetical protein